MGANRIKETFQEYIPWEGTLEKSRALVSPCCADEGAAMLMVGVQRRRVAHSSRFERLVRLEPCPQVFHRHGLIMQLNLYA